MSKKEKKSKGIISGIMTTAAMPILIVLMIIVLLASFVYAIFHGVIEIIKTVLSQILDFLSDPIGWLRNLSRHLHNSWIIAFRWK